MWEFCIFCGRPLQGSDDIAWRCFGMICGGCFLPFAGYLLENMEELGAIVKAHQVAPGNSGEA